MRSRKVDQDELAKHPATVALSGERGTRPEAWLAVFTAKPEVVEDLLADLIKQAHAKPGRIGQRPMPREADVNFAALTRGELNERPIHEVLPGLMGGSSETIVAERAFMSRSAFRRILKGEREPSLVELRDIAAAIGKSPAYFPEYRKAIVMEALSGFFDERPAAAVRLFRSYVTTQEV